MYTLLTLDLLWVGLASSVSVLFVEFLSIVIIGASSLDISISVVADNGAAVMKHLLLVILGSKYDEEAGMHFSWELV